MLLYRNCPRGPRPTSSVACLGLLFAALSGLNACGKTDSPIRSESREEYMRGDHVVAEQSAAVFFEGRVLAVEGEHLRVQAVGGNDSLNVLASDVYRLPPAARDLAPNQLAICGRVDDWLPCRLSEVTGTALRATTAQGVSLDVARDRVLVPSALTELNLKRHFSRNEAEQSFQRSAERAGEPRLEPSWRPTMHERLLVRQGSDWFTGYVRELDEDGAQVTLGSSKRSASVALSALVAGPPSSFAGELRRGDFVLLRPDNASDPWLRWQVRAVNEAEITLVDAAGTTRSASVREVLPLRP